MACWTRSASGLPTRRDPSLSTREAVLSETPARLATSCSVTGVPRLRASAGVSVTGSPDLGGGWPTFRPERRVVDRAFSGSLSWKALSQVQCLTEPESLIHDTQ